jgi:hypothetical protein
MTRARWSDPVLLFLASLVVLGVVLAGDLVLWHLCRWATWTCTAMADHPFMVP